MLEELRRRKGKLSRVVLRIGKLTFLNIKQVKFWVSELLREQLGYAVEVVINEESPVLKCESCGHTFKQEKVEDNPLAHVYALLPPLACPRCGSERITVQKGRECMIEAIYLRLDGKSE